MIGYNNLQTVRSSTNTNSYTLGSYVVASLNSPILVVLASFLRTNESGVTPTGLTWNSIALTEAEKVVDYSTSRSYYAGIWCLLNPTPGTGDIVASPGATMGGAILSAFTLYDAAQVGAILHTETETHTGTNTAFSDTGITVPSLRAAVVCSNAANNPAWVWDGDDLYSLNEGSSTTGEIAGSAAVTTAGNYPLTAYCDETQARTVGVAVQFKGLAGSLAPARRTRTYIRM